MPSPSGSTAASWQSGMGLGSCCSLQGILACFGPEAKRRVLAQACLVSGVVIFCIITASKSKLYLVRGPGGSAAGDGYGDRGFGSGAVAGGSRMVPVAVSLLLLVGGRAWCSCEISGRMSTRANWAENGQYWYGQMFEQLERDSVHRVVVPDGGLRYQGGPPDYNALLRLYAEVARDHGLEVVPRRPEPRRRRMR